MNLPVIVFDFDKTLTNKDTLFGFYRMASKSRLVFFLKLPLFYVCAVVTKLGILSNTLFKIISVKLFLAGYKKNKIEEIGKKYAEKIELNRVYREDFLKEDPGKILIISASYEEYLKPLFPNHKVIGTKLKYDTDNTVNGIIENMHGPVKKQWLHKNGIKEIDLLYTDSFSDKPLMDISKRVILVRNNQKHELKSKATS